MLQRTLTDEGISFVVGPWGRLMHVMPALRITDGDREFQGWAISTPSCWWCGEGKGLSWSHVRMMSFYQGLLPTLDQLSDRPRVSGMADELRMLRAALNGWMDATVRRDGVSKDESDEWVLLSAANLFCLRVVFKPSLLTLTYTSPGPVPVRRSLYSFGSGRHLAPASGILVPSTCF